MLIKNTCEIKQIKVIFISLRFLPKILKENRRRKTYKRSIERMFLHHEVISNSMEVQNYFIENEVLKKRRKKSTKRKNLS